MYKKSLKVTPAEIFIFVMQLLYVASSSEISEYDFYELVIILGYAVAGFMAAIACTTKKVDLLNIVKFSVIIVLVGITAISSAGREFVLLVLYLIILKNATQDRIVNAFYWAEYNSPNTKYRFIYCWSISHLFGRYESCDIGIH